jgi:hypothetical protein
MHFWTANISFNSYSKSFEHAQIYDDLVIHVNSLISHPFEVTKRAIEVELALFWSRETIPIGARFPTKNAPKETRSDVTISRL